MMNLLLLLLINGQAATRTGAFIFKPHHTPFHTVKAPRQDHPASVITTQNRSLFLPRTEHTSKNSRHALSPNATSTTILRRNYSTYIWKKDEHTDYKINYRVEGPISGPPILLVHGFGANANHFRHQIPALAANGHRVYAIDLLGFGASDKPKEEEYRIELWVELLKDFINDMDGEGVERRWVIAGNSMGGLCSLCVSADLQEKIRGCVIFNSSGGMTLRYDELPEFLHPVLYFGQKVLLSPIFGGHFFQNFKTRDIVESVLKKRGIYRDIANVDEELMDLLLGPSEDDGAQEVFLSVLSGSPGPTPESVLPRIKCHILGLWGGQDPLTPVNAGFHPGGDFQKYNKDIRMVVLPGVGHCPHDEAPDLCLEYMLPWLECLPGKADRFR